MMAAVYGPKPVAMKKENAERAVVEIIWRARSGLPGNSSFGLVPILNDYCSSNSLIFQSTST